MITNFFSSEGGLKSGGTISGDVTIEGDLTVNGSGSNSYDEIINGDLHVKTNSTDAFLVEKADGTDVFVVDTDNLQATFSGDVSIKTIGGNNDPATLSLWSLDTSISDNDNIGVILAQGSDTGGSPPYLGGKIEFNADADWDTNTATYYPTRIDFFTQSQAAADATASPRMTISSDGTVGIGTNNPEQLLHLKSSSAFLAFTDDANSGQAGILYRNTSGTNVGFTAYDFTNNNYQIRVNNNIALTIDSNRVVELTSGQLKFPASQNASSDANTLDDYEEGTYEPTLSYSTSGSVSADSNYATLSYTKIGNLVTVQGNIRIGSTGSQSGFLQFSLPFTSHSAGTDFEYRSSNVFLTSGVDFDGTAVGARIEENNSNMLLFAVKDNNSLGNITVAVNDDYFVNITYMAD